MQVELPGGLVEHGERPTLTVKRELHEETGIAQVRAIAQLIPGYLGNDAGTHQERYGIWVALCEGNAVPTASMAAEGIEKVDTLLLANALSYLTSKARDGYLIEWATYLAHAMLQVRLSK